MGAEQPSRRTTKAMLTSISVMPWILSLKPHRRAACSAGRSGSTSIRQASLGNACRMSSVAYSSCETAIATSSDRRSLAPPSEVVLRRSLRIGQTHFPPPNLRALIPPRTPQVAVRQPALSLKRRVATCATEAASTVSKSSATAPSDVRGLIGANAEKCRDLTATGVRPRAVTSQPSTR